jgi:xanthine dehydrogenase accessory factor
VDNPCLSGGALEIFLEPVLPPALVLVVGDAPVARALVRVGRALDHEVRAVAVDAPIPTDAAALVVAAHGGVDEAAALAEALAAGVPYVALVASRRRAAGVLAGVPGAERVHAPAGLDIGARTPAEIALSIYAQLVAERSAAGPASAPAPAEAPEARRQESHFQDAGRQESHLPDARPEPPGEVGLPRPRPAPAVDPVCGMEVLAAAPTLCAPAPGGGTAWFCGPGCRDAYLGGGAG